MESTVNAFWYMSNNFGDNLNYYLIKKLSGKEPVYCDDRANQKHVIVCGSILTEANDNSTIWGAGMANYTDEINCSPDIRMVRGLLTAEKLKIISCELGDPCLLMPRLYLPKVEKKHITGIIPHWKDTANVMDSGFYVINPLKPALEVIEDILSCERIISSSLHGLILSDAYEVPNRWLDLGTAIGGDGFKFDDYYSTTDRPKQRNEKEFWVSGFKYDLDDMIKSCPFI